LIVVLFLLVQAFVPVSQLWKLQLPTNLPKIESHLELLSSKNGFTPLGRIQKKREEGNFFRAITQALKHPRPKP
jgi:hypothetical protein